MDLFHPWSILSQRSAVCATDIAEEEDADVEGEADAVIELWPVATEEGDLEGPTAEDNIISSRDRLSSSYSHSVVRRSTTSSSCCLFLLLFRAA